jgi:hypothetical protein
VSFRNITMRFMIIVMVTKDSVEEIRIGVVPLCDRIIALTDLRRTVSRSPTAKTRLRPMLVATDPLRDHLTPCRIAFLVEAWKVHMRLRRRSVGFGRSPLFRPSHNCHRPTLSVGLPF